MKIFACKDTENNSKYQIFRRIFRLVRSAGYARPPSGRLAGIGRPYIYKYKYQQYRLIRAFLGLLIAISKPPISLEKVGWGISC